MELDPDKATNEYKEKTLSPLRGLIPDESFKVLEEQLSSPCTAEMASFDRFTDFVQDGNFDIVIFDTAPTGHTLRLLELPVQWSGVIEKASKDGSGGQTCIGPAAALANSKAKFDRAITAMRDPAITTFIFVLRPEATPIYEAKRSIGELTKLDINSQEIIINGVYPMEVCDNPFMLARFVKQQKFLESINQEFKVPAKVIELGASEIKGVELLREIGKELFDSPQLLSQYVFKILTVKNTTALNVYPKLNNKISKLLTPQRNNKRLVFFSGKGGVGKTSVSAATALWIANAGYKTLLLTTDPASHLKQVFSQEVTDKPTLLKGEKNLWFTHIDAKAATEEYKENILKEKFPLFLQNVL
jgi:arsenite-transporting ATPase